MREFRENCPINNFAPVEFTGYFRCYGRSTLHCVRDEDDQPHTKVDWGYLIGSRLELGLVILVAYTVTVYHNSCRITGNLPLYCARPCARLVPVILDRRERLVVFLYAWLACCMHFGAHVLHQPSSKQLQSLLRAVHVAGRSDAGSSNSRSCVMGQKPRCAICLLMVVVVGFSWDPHGGP